MAIYQTKLCPHCGTAYVFHQIQGKTYGSPFVTCSKCTKVFIDKDNIEMAIESDVPIHSPKFSFIDVSTTLLGALSFVYSILNPYHGLHSIFLWIGIMMFAGGIYLLVSDLKEYQKREAESAEEFNASVQRMSVPEYANAIKELGFNVPAKYLKPKNTTLQQAVTTNNVIEENIQNQKVKVKPIKKSN